MVRRRRSSQKGPPPKPKGASKKDASIKAWKSRDDIPMDEEDLFHAGRDKILLDGQEDGDTDDDLNDEEEVFGLKGIDSEDDDVDDDQEDDLPETPATSAAKRKSKDKKSTRGPRSSSSQSSESESEDDERWGSKKSAYYSSNAALLGSDDEEANQLEEMEARRLQAKSKELITEDDYGLADVDAVEDAVEPEVNPLDDVALDLAPQLLSKDKASLLRHLELTSPETLALAREWEDIANEVVKTEQLVSKKMTADPDHPSLGLIHLYQQTLLTYATTLSFYLHLRSTPQYALRPQSLISHPILPRLLTLKQGLSVLQALDFAPRDDSSASDGDSDVEWKRSGLEYSELSDLIREQEEDLDLEKTVATPKKEKKKEKKDKSSKKTDKPSKPTKHVFDLVEPELIPTKSSSKKTPEIVDVDSAFGDPTSLLHTDASDKDARRRSLRFHTSKIESTSRRRENARAAVGGDDDLPRKDRRKQKEPLVVKGRGEGGDDLDVAGDVEENGQERKKRVRADDDGDDHSSGGEGDDGYYELVKRQKRAKKEEKKAAYEAEREGDRLIYEEEGAEGPRAITRAILKNKGLTPRRPKSVRNPRVKKKLRYEKAKRTISSQKSVFKGGLESTGGRYDGEKSGINARVVKSVKF
ncbi:hypothetical protein BOTBODRAFT_208901 [Botryobasidium botryosum FD-172 SS1]|uniref:Sas10 C-terminal domain-containing protein n=1 Tax=Botryobasidium botryosum (strain FD-172 SS1) TaxID=930990 RepID=A0A067N0U2_BOTB1|nr:hypothetical protein BOTBODRAFT_208901 [Botryobasidium botryosum FD-172 SS1]